MGTIASDGKAYSRAYAEHLNDQDSLKHLRSEFIIPTKDNLKTKTSPQTCKFHVFHESFKHITSVVGSAGLFLLSNQYQI